MLVFPHSSVVDLECPCLWFILVQSVTCTMFFRLFAQVKIGMHNCKGSRDLVSSPDPQLGKRKEFRVY